MVVLLSNDDGFESAGLKALEKAFSRIAKVYVVAPDGERSATSHKITLNHPIRITKVSDQHFITDGSPADCVKAAFLKLIPEKIDLVISGINKGPNMGTDVFYSGTVAVAREGVLNGVPSIAFSMNSFELNQNFEKAALYGVEIVETLLPELNENTLLNINFPKSDSFKGFKYTKLGLRVYREKLVEYKDPMGRPYFWIGGELPTHSPKKGSDFEAVQNQYVSITPLSLNATDEDEMNRLSSKLL